MSNFPEIEAAKTERRIDNELHYRAIETAKNIHFADDFLAEKLVFELNRKAEQLEAIGETLRLDSDTVIQSRFSINAEGKLRTEPIEDNDDSDSVSGMFVGYELLRSGKYSMLTYRLEKIIDDSRVLFDVIQVPVLGTEAVIIDENLASIDNSQVSEELIKFALEEPEVFQSLKRLSVIEDIKFQRTIHELMLHFQTNKEMNAMTLSKIGKLTTKLINSKESRADLEVESAIMNIVMCKILDDCDYWVVGDFLTEEVVNQEKFVAKMKIARAKIPFEDIALIFAYSRDEKRLILSKDRVQPAFIYGTGSRKFYIPLSSITELTKSIPKSTFCAVSPSKPHRT